MTELISQYYNFHPDLSCTSQKVKFGTSGHRGSAKRYNFNEDHILAISQAIVKQRIIKGITGPCYLGKDTHALSEPAFISVLEVLTANGINIIIQKDNDYTPTPAISHAIIRHNNYARNRFSQADGIIITSSHNPPEDGGIKYNLPNGGPANVHVTHAIEKYSNRLLTNKLRGVKRLTLNKAWQSGYIHVKDLAQKYIEGLTNIINMRAIKNSGLKLCVDSLGGSGVSYWQRIAQFYKLDLILINEKIDKTFSFINLDHDGLISIDCSSELAIAGLLLFRNKFDLAFANDPDCDRHGIVTTSGLINSNHYLSVAINYLFRHRPRWKKIIGVGKTLVSSMMINKVVKSLNRRLIEVPVGFKWFVDDLFNGNIGFGGEESAGGSFLNFNGLPWSTDKDGIIMSLLAAEIIAITGKTIKQHYDKLVQNFGLFSYEKIQISINQTQKKALSKLSHTNINIKGLAGDPVINMLTIMTSTGMDFDGIRVMTRNGWFVTRISGTEEIYKIYCESFLGEEHCQQIKKEAIEFIYSILSKSE